MIKLFMYNLTLEKSKSSKQTRITENRSGYKSANVDINKLLNRVKINSKNERNKKFIVLILAILPIVVTGLTVF